MKYNEKGPLLMTLQWQSWPPSALLTAAMQSSNTVFIRWFRPDKRGIWAAETFQNLTNIVWAWDKFVTPCLLPWIRKFMHTKHHKTRLGLRPRVVLWRCMWINSRICVSKQGVTNDIACNITMTKIDQTSDFQNMLCVFTLCHRTLSIIVQLYLT